MVENLEEEPNETSAGLTVGAQGQGSKQIELFGFLMEFGGIGVLVDEGG